MHTLPVRFKIYLRYMRIVLFAVLFLAISITLPAQKSITNQSLIWYNFNLHIQMKKWFIKTDFQERHYIQPSAQHQFVMRTLAGRSVGNNWDVALGFCGFLQSPNDPYSNSDLIIPELRPFTDVYYRQQTKHLSIDHRYRFEVRFFHNTNTTGTELANGYDFGNVRFRYQLQLTIPVWKIDQTRSLKVRLGDEVMLNAGKKIVTNIFDQNRVWGGLNIDATQWLNFDVGYLNWFQQRSNGKFYNRHILRFGFNFRIDLTEQIGKRKNRELKQP